jgi:hypothetical protein
MRFYTSALTTLLIATVIPTIADGKELRRKLKSSKSEKSDNDHDEDSPSTLKYKSSTAPKSRRPSADYQDHYLVRRFMS